MDIEHDATHTTTGKGKTGATQHMDASSSATRLNALHTPHDDDDAKHLHLFEDCIHEYIKDHVVTETVGSGRVAELVKCCFTICGSSFMGCRLQG